MNNIPITVSTDLAEDDPEVRRVTSCATETQEQASVVERLGYFSNWFHTKRAMAVCLRLKKMYKRTANNDNQQRVAMKTSSRKYTPVNTAEIEEAEKEIIRQAQEQAFHDQKLILQK